MRRQKYILLFPLTFLSLNIFGQNSSNSKSTSKDKKDGYCKIYLNEKAMPTDSANSYFWAYEYYDGGKLVFNAFPMSGLRNRKFTFEGVKSIKGRPVAIDGTLKIFKTSKNNNDILLNENTYKEGYAQIYKEYFSGVDDLWHLIDFTKKYNDMEGSYFVTDYANYLVTTETRKKTTNWWCRKENGKWQMIKAEMKSDL